MNDTRVADAQALLARRGVAGRVTMAGHRGEIAAVLAGPDAALALAQLAPEIKALGFEYVALELSDEGDAA